jgi:hypothetical protein
MTKETHQGLTAIVLTELQASLEAIFHRMPVERLHQYDTLQKDLQATNVAADRKYQRTFADFYKLRGPSSFREIYFSTLEKEKSVNDLDFRRLLHELFAQCTKVHASFTSKLLATINPDLPVYDREVLIRMRFSPYLVGTAEVRLDRAVDRYQPIENFHRHAKQHPRFDTLIASFDCKFPAFHHFTGTKKLDLMMWQSNRVQDLK